MYVLCRCCYYLYGYTEVGVVVVVVGNFVRVVVVFRVDVVVGGDGGNIVRVVVVVVVGNVVRVVIVVVNVVRVVVVNYYKLNKRFAAQFSSANFLLKYLSCFHFYIMRGFLYDFT